MSRLISIILVVRFSLRSSHFVQCQYTPRTNEPSHTTQHQNLFSNKRHHHLTSPPQPRPLSQPSLTSPIPSVPSPTPPIAASPLPTPSAYPLPSQIHPNPKPQFPPLPSSPPCPSPPPSQSLIAPQNAPCTVAQPHQAPHVSTPQRALIAIRILRRGCVVYLLDGDRRLRSCRFLLRMWMWARGRGGGLWVRGRGR